MERFWNDLKEHATKYINYEEKKMISLTNEEKKIAWAKRLLCMQKKI